VVVVMLHQLVDSGRFHHSHLLYGFERVKSSMVVKKRTKDSTTDPGVPSTSEAPCRRSTVYVRWVTVVPVTKLH
jgi:hypothetical protein